LTASEFAFLALGLVLGIASGAALIEVFRARPPGSRSVRVTVAPNAIQSRLASTLAAPHRAPAAGEPAGGPAAGGPGDRRWRDETVATGEPAATGRGSAEPATSGQDHEADRHSGTPVRSAGGFGGTMVAVPMSIEPDPVTTELRASAAAQAVAAMASSATSSSSNRSATATATAPAPAPGRAEGGRGDATTRDKTRSETTSTDVGPGVAGPGVAGPGVADNASPTAPPASTGPCAEERRVADERCAVATRAREGAATAAETLRKTQRTYDEHAARAEAGAAKADPRAVRTAKEQAQQRFREARNQARTRDDVEAGARAWLAEINRINHETREAAAGTERDRAAAAELAPTVERLAVEADAARISAERADEACIAAREVVAVCDEARTLEEAALRSGGPGRDPGSDDGEGASDGRIAAATPVPEDEFAFSTPMNSHAGQDALILRMLRGEHDAMQRAVARLAGDDGDARRRWQTQLGGLAEALIARSIEATAFDFPIDHFFWGPFTQSQNRDIAAGLSSLGFRFDGFGDWVDDRVPSQRDLSLAVGYAGLDPMRVRHWPNEAETLDLLREVRVAADEYVAGAAGGLTLGELVTLLGRRADGLTELWNQWGTVRPILLEAN
jgi:hypothetical protein